MAKLAAPGIQVQRQTTAAPETHLNQYVQLLWVVAAGSLGIALLCIAASIGLADTNSSASEALQSRGIVDLAIANVNTAQALTVEAFSGILPAVTFFPSDTATFTPTFTITSTLSFTPAVTASRTSISLTRTRRPGEGFSPTSTMILFPTQTNTSRPPPTLIITFIPTSTDTPAPTPTVKITKTPRPTRTRTPTPPPTNTFAPVPTDTLTIPPPATDTSIPPLPTDTSAPPPSTDTSVPLPTDTSAPPPAPTDTTVPSNTP